MFGRRSDGRRLDHIDPIVQFMPYVMPTRNDAMNMITEYVDYDPIADYIKKRSKEGVKVSFTALVVAAYTRAIAEYPALNRFIMNKQVFARNTINASLTVLRNAKDKNNLDEALIKMTFKPDATIDEVAEQINRLTADAVDADADNGTADFAGKIIKFRLLVQLVVALARLMDRYGILPKALYDISPFHCSMFITNVASIGLSTIYHHLYNFGNTSIFISLGKFERKAVPSHDGVQFKTVIPLGVVTDERICGGANYAQGLMYFKKLLLHPELLETALTHTSYANESRTPVQHNERLEFLGDSVLQIVSADYLFHAYADRPEGDLTRIRSSLVSEGALFQFAQEINLGDYLRLGRGEEHCGGRTRPSVVSDAFEAVIAALYLDGGMEVAKSFILPFITEGKHAEADYKTRLQEIVQQNPEERLSYVVEQESGPDHDKHFVVAVRFNSDKVARGEGRSKKMAEQHAAREALKLLGVIKEK